jgi:hypothetical protein
VIEADFKYPTSVDIKYDDAIIDDDEEWTWAR